MTERTLSLAGRIVTASGPCLALLCAATALTTPSEGLAGQTGSLVLEPSSPWAINISRDACHLARSFGEGDDTVAVDFRQYGPGRVLTVLALGKSLRYSGEQTPLVSQFEPNGLPHEDAVPRLIEQDGGQGLVETWTVLAEKPAPVAKKSAKKAARAEQEELDPLPFDRQAEGKFTALRLAGPIGRDVVLKLGRMDLPMDQMRNCLDDLMARWGIDPAAYHSLTRRPVPTNVPGSWAHTSDYPEKMIIRGLSGVVHFRLMIDETGKPTDCAVQTAGGSDFDKRTCDLMMHRARFTPALDAAGQPVASFYVNTVRWMAG